MHTIIVMIILQEYSSLFHIEFCLSPTNITWIIVCQDFDSSLVIDWSQFASNCSTEHYFINTSNCGRCPNSTTYKNITCTYAPTDGRVCMTTIQSEISENIYGDPQQFMIRAQPECSTVHESNICMHTDNCNLCAYIYMCLSMHVNL